MFKFKDSTLLYLWYHLIYFNVVIAVLIIIEKLNVILKLELVSNYVYQD